MIQLRLLPVVFLFTSLSVFGQPTWTWQNPLPQGSPLHGLAFVDANTGVATGGYGAMVRTVDGGTSWNEVNIGTSANMNGVAFADANIGVAVGDSGAVLRSTDKGATWSRIATGNGALLLGIAFADASVGVAVGRTGIIRRTTDAGLTWSGVTSGSSNMLHCVAFSNALNGVACGVNGTILSTSDAGVHWTAQTSNTLEDINGVAFQSATIGHVVGGGGYTANTTDGGQTWTPRALPSPITLYSVQYAPGTDYIIAAGEYASDSATQFILSPDTGNSWYSLFSPSSYNAIYAMHVFDTNNIVAVGDMGVLWSTTDFGVTWNNGQGGTSTSLYDVTYFDSSSGIVTGYGTVLGTTDQGRHWNSIPATGDAYYVGCTHVNATTGFVYGFRNDGSTPWSYAIVANTTDAGATWNDVSPTDSLSIQGSAFVNANTGWVAGNIYVSNTSYPACIEKTIDGGATWVQENTGGHVEGLYSVAFADANTGIVVGDNGLILRTVNGGGTWSQVSSAQTNALYSVAYAGNGVFVATAADGSLIRTTNYGAIWSTVNLGSPLVILALRFATPRVGLAVGDSGLVLRTTDAGATWKQLSSPTNAVLSNVCLTDSLNATIVGNSGVILRLHLTAASTDTTVITPTKPVFVVSPTSLNFDTVLVDSVRSLVAWVHNPSIDSLIISSITSDNSVFTVKPATAIIHRGDSLKVTATFSPTSLGVKTGHMLFNDNTAAQHDTITLRGVVMKHSLGFNTLSLDCGSVHVDSTSYATLIVRNVSDTAISITSTYTDDLSFTTFPTAFTLARGDTISVRVKFKPRFIGSAVSHIVFQHTGYLGADFVSVRGTGTMGQLSVSSTTLSFGDVPLDLVRSQYVVVSNDGNAPVALSGINVTSDHFTVSPDTGLTIAGGDAVQFQVQFTASDTVRQNAWLVFEHKDGATSDSVKLSGRGVYVDLLVTPEVLDFGTVTAGQSLSLPFVIHNRSVQTANILQCMSPEPHFTVAPDHARILAGDSAIFTVTFNSDDSATYSAPMVIVHDLSPTPDTVRLLAAGKVIIIGVSQREIPADYGLDQNYPNPFSSTTTFSFAIPQRERVTLNLVSVLGEIAQTVADGMFESGTHHIDAESMRLTPGVYLAQMVVKGRMISRVVDVVR